ncbi:MAG: twin-arginine translocase TatA/TatE family subunit [Kiritimatiellae bacterium]|nr:twin-arginine translocase TatA/TatE family subunit [Kiritimatiellia bacterium]
MALALIFDSAGFGEWFVLLAVVLIVVGPRNLPSAARKLGSLYSKFRRAAEGFRRQLMEMENEMDRAARSAEREVEDAFTSGGDESQVVPSGEPDAVGSNHPAPQRNKG